MKVIGKPVFTFHDKIPGAFVIEQGFTVITNTFTYEMAKGTVINGASIPFLATIFFDRYNPEYFLASAAHDDWVGEFGRKAKVKFHSGIERELSWVEAAKAFRELMKVDVFVIDGKEVKNRVAGKFKRRVFYHAVMLKSRAGLKS